MAFLDISNVTKSYGAVEVLHRVDIAMQEGEILVPGLEHLASDKANSSSSSARRAAASPRFST